MQPVAKAPKVVPNNLNEIKNITSLLKQKPEIDCKIDYYRAILKATAEKIDAIDKEIETQVSEYTVRFLGIPIKITKKVTNVDRCNLLSQRIEAEHSLFYQKKYYENWLARKKDHDVYFEQLSSECNRDFDATLEKAKKVAERNIRLSQAMSKYHNEDNDQALKNEYFLYLKKEIQNAKDFG